MPCPSMWPNWFGPDQFIFVVTISFWSWPNHYGQVQINLVRPKPFWTDQNCFGYIEGQGINTYVLLENYYSFASYFKPKPAHRSFILKNVYLIIVFVFWTVFESFFIKILMYLLNVLTYRTQTNQKNIHWLHCGLIDKIIRHSHLKINLTQVQVLVLVLPQLCILLKMVQNWLLWQEILLKFVYSEKANKNVKTSTTLNLKDL